MENQIICPHCKKTISNDSDMDCESKGAGLASTYVYCECGEKITFSAIITQLRGQNYIPQGLKIDFINLPWLETGTGLP